MTDPASVTKIQQLLDLMALLRDPVRGCAWDIVQTADSIVPYTIEEAYEVADAVASGHPDQLHDELGDLLLQVVFQARIASESGDFDFTDVVSAILAKLIRRHPHVVDGSGQALPASERIDDPEAIARAWQRIKAEERAAKPSTTETGDSPLGGIARGLPALMRAEKLSRRAASFGFDWDETRDVVAKVREEIAEVEEAMIGRDRPALVEEIGDLLFSVANLARHLDVDPEDALRRGNAKFERRFTAMSHHLAEQGRSLDDSDLEAMENAWQEVKRKEFSE